MQWQRDLLRGLRDGLRVSGRLLAGALIVSSLGAIASAQDGGINLDQLQQQLQQQRGSASGTGAQPSVTPRDTILEPTAPPAPLVVSPLEQLLSVRAGVRLQQYGYDQLGIGRAVSLPQVGAVQDNYILGVGDEIVLTLRGQENNEYRAQIDRDGNITFPRLNPVAAAGRSFGRFRQDLTNAVRRAYVSTDAFITVGRLRQISVLVSGEVGSPGVRTLTGLSTVVDAIFVSGGIKKSGSLRNIRIVRDGRERSVDLYGMLVGRGGSSNYALADGDKVIVPPLGATVAVAGVVRRPGIYELAPGQSAISVHEAVALASGMTVPGAYQVSQLRTMPDGRRQLVDVTGGTNALLHDGEIVFVRSSVNISVNQVTLEGAVRTPGAVPLGKFKTLHDVLSSSDVFTPTAYMLFGMIERTDPATLQRSVIPFSPLLVVQGKANVPLVSDDKVHILSRTGMRTLVRLMELTPEETAPTNNVRGARSQTGTRNGQTPGVPGSQAFSNPGTRAFQSPNNNPLVDTTGNAAGAAPMTATGQPMSQTMGQSMPSTMGQAMAPSMGQSVAPGMGQSTPLPQGMAMNPWAQGNAVPTSQYPGQYPYAGQYPGQSQYPGNPTQYQAPGQYPYPMSGQYPLPGQGTTATWPNMNGQPEAVPGLESTTPGMNPELASDPDVGGFRVSQISFFKKMVAENRVIVSGAVRDPGTYLVFPGTPIADLVATSGGFTDDVDLNAFELTSTVIDNSTGSSTTERKTYPASKEMFASLGLRPFDRLVFRNVYSDRNSGIVKIDGEVRHPGSYDILRGEKLSSVLRRAGGYTESAYPEGAVFQRESVAIAEEEESGRIVADMRSQLLAYLFKPQQNGSTAPNADTITAVQSLLAQVSATPAIGRVPVVADLHAIEKHPELDTALEPGDSITVPRRPATVLVMGEVLRAGAQRFYPSQSADDYVEKAGGTTEVADTSRIIIVLPDGSVRADDNSWLNFGFGSDIPPGSTIYVPRNLEPFQFRELLTDSIQIVSQLATSAAALAVLSKQ